MIWFPIIVSPFAPLLPPKLVYNTQKTAHIRLYYTYDGMQNVSCFSMLQDVAPILNHLVALVQDLESKKTTASTTSAGPTTSTTTVPPQTASTSVGSHKTIVGQMKNDSHLHHNVPPAMLIARDSPMSHLHEEYKYDVCKSQGTSAIPFFFICKIKSCPVLMHLSEYLQRSQLFIEVTFLAPFIITMSLNCALFFSGR